MGLRILRTGSGGRVKLMKYREKRDERAHARAHTQTYPAVWICLGSVSTSLLWARSITSCMAEGSFLPQGDEMERETGRERGSCRPTGCWAESLSSSLCQEEGRTWSCVPDLFQTPLPILCLCLAHAHKNKSLFKNYLVFSCGSKLHQSSGQSSIHLLNCQ